MPVGEGRAAGGAAAHIITEQATKNGDTRRRQGDRRRLLLFALGLGEGDGENVVVQLDFFVVGACKTALDCLDEQKREQR